MPGTRAYESQLIELIRDEKSRRFLQEVGLPVDNLLFGFAEVVTRSLETNGEVRTVVRIGEGGDTEEFCVDVESGGVVVLNVADGSIWHVNESVEKFFRCLGEFASGLPYGGQDSDLDDREGMAVGLKYTLMNVDATALDEDPGYWHSVLHDVCMGDYSE